MFCSQRPRARTRQRYGEILESRDALSVSPAVTMVSRATAPPLQWGGAELTAAVSSAKIDTNLQYIHDTMGFTGRGQTIAVIDTGIAYDHAALGNGLGSSHRVVGGWDFSEGDANPYDDGPAGFHGTHVAGIAASSDPHHIGLAPEADLVGLRVFNDQGWGSFAWIEEALQWVHQHQFDFANPITTVNMSLGTEWNSTQIPNWSQIEDELALLEADNIVVVASAGNSFSKFQTPGLNYPAASSHVIAAASVDASGQLSKFSQRVGGVLAAPGENIVSTVPDYLYDFNGVTDDFATATGTSMAAPYISGASVLVRQALQKAGSKNITPQAIEDLLRQTADSQTDTVTGIHYAKINLRRALESLAPAKEVPQTPTTPVAPAPPNGPLPVQPLGQVTQANFELSTTPTGNRYSFTATYSGWLTLEWLRGTRGTASLHHTDGAEIIRLAPNATPARWDFPVHAGQTVELWLQGSVGKENLRVTNLVERIGSQFTVHGSGGIDHFQLIASGSFFTINETPYSLGINPSSQVAFENWQATDSVQFLGSSADERVRFTTNELNVSRTNGSQTVLRGFKTANFQGGGGRDSARILGTAGNDVATLAGDSAVVRGSDYEFTVTQTSMVDITGGGGQDTANWTDTAGTDHFISGPAETHMQGTGYLTSVRGFSRHVVTSQSQSDWAYLTGSNLDDRFWASATSATFTSGGQSVDLSGFARVFCQAGQGGNDSARLEGDLSPEHFTANPAFGVLSGRGYYNLALGFAHIAGITPDQHDQAFLASRGSGTNALTILDPLPSDWSESNTVDLVARGVASNRVSATPTLSDLSQDNPVSSGERSFTRSRQALRVRRFVEPTIGSPVLLNACGTV